MGFPEAGRFGPIAGLALGQLFVYSSSLSPFPSLPPPPFSGYRLHGGWGRGKGVLPNRPPRSIRWFCWGPVRLSKHQDPVSDTGAGVGTQTAELLASSVWGGVLSLSCQASCLPHLPPPGSKALPAKSPSAADPIRAHIMEERGGYEPQERDLSGCRGIYNHPGNLLSSELLHPLLLISRSELDRLLQRQGKQCNMALY